MKKSDGFVLQADLGNIKRFPGRPAFDGPSILVYKGAPNASKITINGTKWNVLERKPPPGRCEIGEDFVEVSLYAGRNDIASPFGIRSIGEVSKEFRASSLAFSHSLGGTLTVKLKDAATLIRKSPSIYVQYRGSSRAEPQIYMGVLRAMT